MASTNCNADGHANDLYVSLTSDAPNAPDINIADITYNPDTTSDLYSDVESVTLQQLTECDLEGDGVFDTLMKTVDLHVEREFKGGRITGDEYAKVYIELVNAVLGTSTQFLLQKDQARWNAIKTQMEARTAEVDVTVALVNLEKIKAEAAKTVFDMQNSGAQYALTKMQTAIADAEYCLKQAQSKAEQYKVNFLLPAEKAIQEYQRMQVLPSTVAINRVQADRILPAEAAIKEFTNHQLQPIERDIQQYNLDEALPVKVGIDKYQLDNLLPVTLGQEQYKLNSMMPSQNTLTKEQAEAARAQTMDVRSDGLTPVSGMVGKQKDDITLDIEGKRYNIDETLPVQLEMIEKQRDLVGEQIETERAKTSDNRTDGTTAIAGTVGKQNELIDEQIILMAEQVEVERAKTLDTRRDSAPVTGSVGKQKELYDQQIDSFIKDAEQKVAKMYLDAWVTQKTLDEGLEPPNEFVNSSVNDVLYTLRNNHGLFTP